MPWDAEIRKLQAQFFDRPGYKGSNAVRELETRGYFHKLGEKETTPISFEQSLDDFIEGLHSRSNFSRERMEQKAKDPDE